MEFTPEQEAFRQEIKDFFKETLPADFEPMDSGAMYHADTREFAHNMAKKLSAKGWLTMLAHRVRRPEQVLHRTGHIQ